MMTARRIGTIAFFAALLACQQFGDKRPQGLNVQASSTGKIGSSTPARIETVAPVVHVPTPDTLRGLYVNRWAALGSKLDRLI
ncbi:MAG TPA: hypothetical protein VF387_03115, partial [Gemmatimonadaceae bacterium]